MRARSFEYLAGSAAAVSSSCHGCGQKCSPSREPNSRAMTMLTLASRRLNLLFFAAICLRFAGCEMKRGGYSLGRHTSRTRWQHGCCRVSSSITPPSPAAWQRVLVSSINSRLAKHSTRFTRFQRAAARSGSTFSSTSSSNRTPEYTTYLWISMPFPAAQCHTSVSTRWGRLRKYTEPKKGSERETKSDH